MATKRAPCPPAPGPLEAYAARFDDRFGQLAQRRAFRAYLHGLLLPRERNKTLTALAGTEPVIGAPAPPAQRLQWFLSEAAWDVAAITARRLELLLGDPATAPTDAGVLIIDETGDPKDGSKTPHVAKQSLGSLGKVAHGIVAVSTVWADAAIYYPLHVRPYTPASRLPGGQQDPAFRTKPQLAVELVDQAIDAGVRFRAVVADCLYGTNAAFEAALWTTHIPFVLDLRPSRGTWGPAEGPHTPVDAARLVAWGGRREPGGWVAVARRFRDGHRETWWAAELTLPGYGPDLATRLLAVTTDPATLPAASTWYLTTNLPRPGSPVAAESGLAPADLRELVHLYGLRQWVEQSYRQVKGALGWADWQVRSDRAIRRHWELVCSAFCFCWWAWRHGPDDQPPPVEPPTDHPLAPAAAPSAGWGGKVAHGRVRRAAADDLVAGGAAAGAGVADAVDLPVALVAGLVDRPAARGPAGVT
jgi:SRSO17 transposase